jgi:murein DD-endopeptidase MepM/ murein hydrolase activator NlpD
MRKVLTSIPLFAALFFSQRLYSFEWPDPSATAIAGFGSPGSGKPSLGIVFASQGPIRHIESGEIIFMADSGPGASRLQSPLGSWLAVDHGNSLISMYGRFREREYPAVQGFIDKGSLLGNSGASGWSTRDGFYFSLYDRAEQRWVNPSVIIRPMKDTRIPAIRTLNLIARDGTVFNAAGLKNLRQGVYRIAVEATDTQDDAPTINLTPYSIVCLVNGSEQGALHLETIWTQGGIRMVSRNAPHPAGEVYAQSPLLELGEARLTRGKASIEIIARDIAGNQRNQVYSFQVD